MLSDVSLECENVLELNHNDGTALWLYQDPLNFVIKYTFPIILLKSESYTLAQAGLELTGLILPYDDT